MYLLAGLLMATIVALHSVVPVHGFTVNVGPHGDHSAYSFRRARACRCSSRDTDFFLYDRSHPLPSVWIEEADADFVDANENLEVGEVCLRSVKAFATQREPTKHPRFLCAGALVQRPLNSSVCDAWTADSVLEEGGPNLQFQGAVQVLNDLLLFHLKRHSENTILGLQTFVVRCGSLDNEFTCASYMAAKSRGFRPLRDLLRTSSIYTASHYDHDLDGMVLDVTDGKRIYKQLATSPCETMSETDRQMATQIYECLPDDDTIRRCSHKRFIASKRLR